MLEGASGLDLDLRPVDGVDGKTIAPENWRDFDRSGFELRNGRHALPGEYGCYASHIKALELFLSTDAPVAVVVEDDVAFTPDFSERVKAIVAIMPDDAIVKLTNHRRKGFKGRGTSALGDSFGRCIYGPQGSSACYIISRRAAQRFVNAARVMTLLSTALWNAAGVTAQRLRDRQGFPALRRPEYAGRDTSGNIRRANSRA